MVKRAFRAITAKVDGLQKAAFWLAFFSALSILLGFIRDRILAHYFGAGQELDVYYAAFKIPDLLFATVASIVSASILVPMLYEKSSEQKDLNKFVNYVFSYFSLLIIVSCAIVFVSMPWIIRSFYSGFDPISIERTILFSRILLLSPLFLGLSNFFGSIVQFEKRFMLYSLSPLLYNLGIILSLSVFTETLGITSAIIGVAFGAFLHMVVQASFVFSTKERPRLIFDIFSKKSFENVKRVFLLSIPRTISLSVSSIVAFLFVAMASRLGTGSIAVFTLAFNLQSVLLSLIGSSYSMATFPVLADHYVKKETELLTQCLSQGLRYIIFWSVPLAALFIVLRAHIVRVVLGSGAFDWSDTRMTAAVLALFVVSVVFQSIQLFLTRAHYAFGNTRLPLTMNLTGALFTVLLAVLFYTTNGTLNVISSQLALLLKVSDLSGVSVLILPLSFSLGSLLSAFLLWMSLDASIRNKTQYEIGKSFADSILSSLVLSGAVIFTLRIFNDYFDLDSAYNVFLHGFLSGLIGIVAAITVLFLLKNKELEQITGGLKSRL